MSQDLYLRCHIEAPKYTKYQKVFIIGKDGYSPDTIESIYFKTKGDVLVVYGYETTLQELVFQDDITTDENYARNEAAFTEIEFDDQIWEEAIGTRGYDPDYEEITGKIAIEDSDLGICCGDISKIRDILLECKENEGLNKRKIRNLTMLISSHGECPDGKSLRMILSALGVEIKEEKCSVSSK